MTFKVELEGLETFKKQLQGNSAMKSIVPDFTLAVLQIHNTLERRVSELFNAPGTLSNVLIGKSVKPVQLGNTFLRYSLQYRYKAIRLGDYPFTVSNSNSLSSAPLRGQGGFIHWTKGRFSKDVRVSVRKGKPSIARKGLGNFDKRRGFIQGRNIKARDTSKTWTLYPTNGREGIRAPYSTLYGPSLSQLANKVYDKDKQVELATENLQTTLIDAFIRYYS